MRKLAGLLCVMVLFTGCLGNNRELERMMELRALILAGGCGFDMEITADYGSEVHTFGMYCESDSRGNVGFSVTGPDSIAGITGRFESGEGKLSFEDVSLAFPLLADGQVTPVSAPYLLVKTLRGGYIRSVGKENELLRVTIDDSYEEDALQLDIWLDEEDLPVRAEILYGGRRILTMTVSNFHFL